MPYILEITIPGLPPTTNASQYQHWTIKAKNIKMWRQKVVVFVGLKRPQSPLPKARLTLIRHSSQEPDHDGLVASFKSISDGLIDAGVIVNDKPSNIGQPTYMWQKARMKEGHIVVKVEECE